MMKKLAVILTLVGGLYYAFKNTKNVLTKHLTLSTKLTIKIPDHYKVLIGNFYSLFEGIKYYFSAFCIFDITTKSI